MERSLWAVPGFKFTSWERDQRFEVNQRCSDYDERHIQRLTDWKIQSNAGRNWTSSLRFKAVVSSVSLSDKNCVQYRCQTDHELPNSQLPESMEVSWTGSFRRVDTAEMELICWYVFNFEITSLSKVDWNHNLDHNFNQQTQFNAQTTRCAQWEPGD